MNAFIFVVLVLGQHSYLSVFSSNIPAVVILGLLVGVKGSAGKWSIEVPLGNHDSALSVRPCSCAGVCLGYPLHEALAISSLKPINKKCCHAHTWKLNSKGTALGILVGCKDTDMSLLSRHKFVSFKEYK